MKTKVGIVGAGARHAAHAGAAAQTGLAEVKWICDIAADRAEAAAAKCDARATADYGDILDDPETACVVIVTNVETHAEIASAALARGKHVLVEKPLADSVATARRLVQQWSDSGLVGMVSFQSRFNRVFAGIHDICERVDPLQVLMSRQRGMMKPQFLSPGPFSGLMDTLAHDFDLAAWFMGRRPAAVTASVRRDSFTADTGAIDLLSALVEFEDGRSASMVGSLGGGSLGWTCYVVGAAGNVAKDSGNRLRACEFERFGPASDAKEVELPDVEFANPDSALHARFYRAVQAEDPAVQPDLTDGLNSMLLTLGCVQSAEEGRRVSLDELT